MNTEVFIIITSLFTGGAERQAIWLANNLLQKGYKVNLLVLKKGDELSHLLLDGVKVYRFQIYSVEYKRRFKLLKILRLAFLSIKKTRRIIRESEKQNQIVACSSIVDAAKEKYPHFNDLLIDSDPSIFWIIPSLIVLRSL